MRKESAIILFGKFPREGFVKTRLAQSVGEEKALSFYQRCLRNIFAEAESITSAHDVFFCFAEAEDEAAVKKLVPKSFKLIAQSKHELPIRIQEVFESVFQCGYERVIIFPTDVPELSSKVMLQAADALKSSECVIGPDSDGGYYCLGMKTYNPKLLKTTYGVTIGMYTQTIENAIHNKITWVALPEISDIDTIEDLKAFELRNPLIWTRYYSDIFNGF